MKENRSEGSGFRDTRRDLYGIQRGTRLELIYIDNDGL